MAQRVKKVVLIETPEDPGIKGIGHKKGIPGKSLSGATPEMYVQLRNGTSLIYFGVPSAVFDKALAAERTVGAYITKHIRPFYASGHLLENRDVVFTWSTKARQAASPPSRRFRFMGNQIPGGVGGKEEKCLSR